MTHSAGPCCRPNKYFPYCQYCVLLYYDKCVKRYLIIKSLFLMGSNFFKQQNIMVVSYAHNMTTSELFYNRLHTQLYYYQYTDTISILSQSATDETRYSDVTLISNNYNDIASIPFQYNDIASIPFQSRYRCQCCSNHIIIAFIMKSSIN